MTRLSRLPAGIRRPLRIVLGGPGDKRPRDVVPIARALLHGMGGRQSFAAVVEDQAGEEAGILRVCSRSPIDPVLGEDGLDLVPKGLVDDWPYALRDRHCPCA